ncbi:AUXIN-INDUCED PROTEIN-LIKE-RELATED [Salix purpurea]|uniref:AUXIN-INDUCED PROTEIN-LIKE-RELATED n=1 Tax=Salix purpurea TaxID=77065 RepID=A0A9Q1A9Y8_SALPP|nr:AUXIN-INDUCED PROTEIN-LIKE-RELATED [Salix purpurea]
MKQLIRRLSRLQTLLNIAFYARIPNPPLPQPPLTGDPAARAQEYGYEQRGGLRIPCHVLVFERVIDSLRLGHESGDLEDLLGSLFIFEDYL